MPRTRHAVLGLAAALALAACPPAVARGEFIFSLDPRGAYLRVNGETPPDAVLFDLLALGIRPGDFITLTRLGDFRRGNTPPYDVDAFLDMTAVFSPSDLLGPRGDLHRV